MYTPYTPFDHHYTPFDRFNSQFGPTRSYKLCNRGVETCRRWGMGQGVIVYWAPLISGGGWGLSEAVHFIDWECELYESPGIGR